MVSDVEERFWEKVDRGGPGECWLWTAATGSGYGLFRFRDSNWTAHRVSYTLEVGEIPEARKVVQSCGEKLCVNPEHLELEVRMNALGVWERFLLQWARDLETGCWEWSGSTAGGGYARLSVDGERVQAHRWVYEELIGDIPEGRDLDHLCRNRGCVNPGHVEPVTRRENLVRGETRIAEQVEQTHCKRGHEFTEENTYVTSEGKRQCRACKRRHGREAYREKGEDGEMGECPECGETYALKGGRLYAHGPVGGRCPGSGEEPVE